MHSLKLARNVNRQQAECKPMLTSVWWLTFANLRDKLPLSLLGKR